MRRWSLHARLLLIAALTGLAALVFATLAIGNVLERFVLRGLDQTLDTQITVLRRATDGQGRLDRSRVIELPGFDDPDDDWSWQVHSPAGDWRSGDQVIVDLRGTRGERHDKHKKRKAKPRAAEGRNADGERVHLRRFIAPLAAGGSVEITVGAPRKLIDRPLRAAQGSLLLSLGLLALGLAGATLVQLRYGLRPVRALRDAVARVRVGESPHLPTDQPSELRPLAEEVNALIDQNRAGLESARRHVANLAHGLKTPLATLSARLAREGASADVRALVDELDTRIAHHLRRARAAAPSAGQRARADVGEVVADLIYAMQHVHADRMLTIEAAVDRLPPVAVDRRDLEEILGNLIDNACRHAVGRVRVTSRTAGPAVRVAVEDDGNGMSDEEVARAMQAGVRLDESAGGYGFGLGIALELVELYGGRLSLSRSGELGGLEAALTLPPGSS